jgi:hypothetical protein
LFDADQHALAVDVGDLERNDFRDPQPGSVGDAQRRLVFEAGSRLQKTSHLVGAQYDRHLARLVNERHLPAKVGAIERHVEEEP